MPRVIVPKTHNANNVSAGQPPVVGNLVGWIIPGLVDPAGLGVPVAAGALVGLGVPVPLGEPPVDTVKVVEAIELSGARPC